MLRVILILATLVVVDLDPGVGVFLSWKVLPLPLWLLRPHLVGLLNLFKDVGADDMLSEVRQHLCMGQHCGDVFKERCLWICGLAECPCNLVDREFVFVQQLLVVHCGEFHKV